MNYILDLDSASPAYYQLYDMIRRDIVEGVYAYGSKLPSKRVITAHTGVSVITVEHALAMLADEGYIEARERSGYFVIYRSADFNLNLFSPEDAFTVENSRMEGVALDTGQHRTGTSNSSEDLPFATIAKSMRKVILDQGERLMEKSPNFGTNELRSELRKYLARSRGIHVREEQIVIGSGAEYLYSLIAGLFADRKLFAIEDPSYEKIGLVYETSGKTVLRLKVDSAGIPSNLIHALEADILHVTPFHSYPTGATADVSKRNEYLRWASKKERYLIEDNYDSELTVSRKAEESLFSMDSSRVIYINTFSKTIASAMRVGYALLPEQLLPAFTEKFGSYSCTVPVFEQLLIAELIQSGVYERHINRVRRIRRKTQ